MSVADSVYAIFAARGQSAYFGERVSITEHALQAAQLARREGAPAALIAAALLHDIGHLLDAAPDDLALWTEDARHEESGARWLDARFGAEVAAPVRLHVAAKRYLCATDAAYSGELSPASIVTLKLQGGPMSAAEIAAFETRAEARAAVRLRRWDDQAKVPALATAGLDAYRAILEALEKK